MKKISFFLIIVLFTSCVSSKKAIENQAVKSSKSEELVATEVPDSAEMPSTTQPFKTPKSPQPQTIEIVEEAVDTLEEEPIIEHETTFEYFDHSLWKDLLKNNVSENGNVNYKGFKSKAKTLRTYIDSLITNKPKSNWPRNDKLAYWINAYNALTVDLIIRNHPLNSIKDIKNPWDQRLWKFEDKWYNLNDIEHQILRKMNEPRIHFAIVCASESCPKLQNVPFYASSLDEDLNDATKEFLADTSKNKLSKDRIALSKIFKWFKKDFEQNGSLIDFLNAYSDIEISGSAKKSFKDYNWDLNE